MIYWSVALALAVVGAHASTKSADAADPAVLGATLHPIFAMPDGRALLLGLGILAIAYTYQRIWLNWRRDGSA